jgi:hypothetical protein
MSLHTQERSSFFLLPYLSMLLCFFGQWRMVPQVTHRQCDGFGFPCFVDTHHYVIYATLFFSLPSTFSASLSFSLSLSRFVVFR